MWIIPGNEKKNLGEVYEGIDLFKYIESKCLVL